MISISGRLYHAELRMQRIRNCEREMSEREMRVRSCIVLRPGVVMEGDFAEKLTRYVTGSEEIGEIPRRQRYVSRPQLQKQFDGKLKRPSRTRDCPGSSS